MHTKNVIVTGASRGIGKAIALHFAKQGYQVAICCKNSFKALTEVQSAIQSYGVSCLTYQADTGNYKDCKKMVQDILSHWKHIDVLINNAGISKIGLLQDMTPEEWDELLHANLYSAFHCCHEVIPQMVHQKSGKIINISSVWGCVGASTETAYSATKGGINAFTKALAKELAPSNIQVNSIACGIIDTSMNGFLSSDELEAITDEIPAGRMGTPEEVANMTWQLIHSPSYLTGQVIRLDGGWI